jgi:hypothetical protein
MGAIVVGGQAVNPADDFALARYMPDGDLDPAFGTAGIVVTDLGFSADIILAVNIQSDGKIVAAGSSDLFGGDKWGLGRAHSDAEGQFGQSRRLAT